MIRLHFILLKKTVHQIYILILSFCNLIDRGRTSIAVAACANLQSQQKKNKRNKKPLLPRVCLQCILSVFLMSLLISLGELCVLLFLG